MSTVTPPQKLHRCEHSRPVSFLLKGLIRRKNKTAGGINEKTKLSNAATENRASKPTFVDMIVDPTLFFFLFHLNRCGSPPACVISLLPLWFPWWFYVKGILLQAGRKGLANYIFYWQPENISAAVLNSQQNCKSGRVFGLELGLRLTKYMT